MTLPSAADLYAAIEATWPPASRSTLGPWTIRDGAGGGSRVSAATTDSPVTTDDLPQAEAAMRALSQPPLFMIRNTDAALDTLLAAQGYTIKDPVTLYACPIEILTKKRPPPITTFEAWPPLAAMAEIWETGGIGPSRLAVMERAKTPKTGIMGRSDDHPAATAYIGQHGPLTMLHALETLPEFRRRGLGRHILTACAFWGRDHGATHLTLVTTDENTASNALYTSIGMTAVGHYHYRIHPKAT